MIAALTVLAIVAFGLGPAWWVRAAAILLAAVAFTLLGSAEAAEAPAPPPSPSHTIEIDYDRGVITLPLPVWQRIEAAVERQQALIEALKRQLREAERPAACTKEGI